jgi:hypothetical protein
MILNAICIVQGPGTLALHEKNGVLTIYTKDQLHLAPSDALEYTIEPGFTRFYLGESDIVQEIVGTRSQYVVDVAQIEV